MPFEVSFELYNRPALPLLSLRKQRAALYRSKCRGLAAYRSYCTVAAHIFHNGQPGHVWIFPFVPGANLRQNCFRSVSGQSRKREWLAKPCWLTITHQSKLIGPEPSTSVVAARYAILTD